jgi:hypothetical protein
MHRRIVFEFILMFGLLLASAGSVLAQGSPDHSSRALVVNGKTLTSGVTQINGHSYVDVEALAQVTNGTVVVEPNRVVLTIPAPDSGAPTAAAPPSAAAPAPPEFSRDFASASVSALADMREWRGAVGMMITYGLVVSDSWTHEYHDKVEAGLAQAAVAASTESDQNALPLLRNEFDKLTAWADEVLAARQNLNGAKTIDPDALKNDPALANITACGRFLNRMIVSGNFTDNSSCH